MVTGTVSNGQAELPEGRASRALSKCTAVDNRRIAFWFKETDPYPKYRTQQFVINLFKGRLWINKYPMYLKHLYLLYYQKANTDNPLSSDCVYSISQYLKPNTIFDYEVLWDNWA